MRVVIITRSVVGQSESRIHKGNGRQIAGTRVTQELRVESPNRDVLGPPTFCIGCARRLGLASILNGVAAQQEMCRQTIAGGQTATSLTSRRTPKEPVCLQLSKAAPEATPTSNCTGGKVNRLRVAGLSE